MIAEPLNTSRTPDRRLVILLTNALMDHPPACGWRRDTERTATR